jgi:hypothetical protein
VQAILPPVVRLIRIEDQDRGIDDKDSRADRRVVGYEVVHVFEQSETEGKPIPEVQPTLIASDLPCPLERDRSPHRGRGLRLSVSDDPRLDGGNGVTIRGNREVVVRESLPGAQR